MRNTNLKTLELFLILIMAVVVGCWITNLVKLSSCDFESPYKCEVVHAIGIIPHAALVTVWFNFDESVSK